MRDIFVKNSHLVLLASQDIHVNLSSFFVLKTHKSDLIKI